MPLHSKDWDSSGRKTTTKNRMEISRSRSVHKVPFQLIVRIVNCIQMMIPLLFHSWVQERMFCHFCVVVLRWKVLSTVYFKSHPRYTRFTGIWQATWPNQVHVISRNVFLSFLRTIQRILFGVSNVWVHHNLPTIAPIESHPGELNYLHTIIICIKYLKLILLN